MSRPNSTALRRCLGVLALFFFLLATERLVNAAMVDSDIGARTAWMFSAALAFTGTVLLGLLLLSRDSSSDRIDAKIGSSHGRRKA